VTTGPNPARQRHVDGQPRPDCPGPVAGIRLQSSAKRLPQLRQALACRRGDTNQPRRPGPGRTSSASTSLSAAATLAASTTSTLLRATTTARPPIARRCRGAPASGGITPRRQRPRAGRVEAVHPRQHMGRKRAWRAHRRSPARLHPEGRCGRSPGRWSIPRRFSSASGRVDPVSASTSVDLPWSTWRRCRSPASLYLKDAWAP